MDEDLRRLERKLSADPSDEAARWALGLALLRSGSAEASTVVGANEPRVYGQLVRAAESDPALEPLLDGALEWRSAGGDSANTRWSRAAPVEKPRTSWRLRIANVRAALALVVDRGRAIVLALAPEPTLVALAVSTGRELWRVSLGAGVASAPVARGGTVWVAIAQKDRLSARALDARTGAPRWTSVAPDLEIARGLPGALALSGDTLVLPIPTSWRGISSAPERTLSASVVAFAASHGETLWRDERHQVSGEVAVLDGEVWVATDFATEQGRLVALDLATGGTRAVSLLGGSATFVSARERVAVGGTGRLVVAARKPGETDWSTMGGTLSSLALDEKRLLVGRGLALTTRDLATGAQIASWGTAHGPLPFAPRGTSQAPPAPRSVVAARDLAFVASPLAPEIAAFQVDTGALAWRHEVEGLLVPEEGPLTWPTAEVAPADAGPLFLAPLPGRLLGITLSGYAFLIEDGPG